MGIIAIHSEIDFLEKLVDRKISGMIGKRKVGGFNMSTDNSAVAIMRKVKTGMVRIKTSLNATLIELDILRQVLITIYCAMPNERSY